MSGKINCTHDPKLRRPEQLEKYGIEPSSNSSRSETKYVACMCTSYKVRALNLHVHRRRKQTIWNVTPHYKLENERVTGAMVVKAVHETFGLKM